MTARITLPEITGQQKKQIARLVEDVMAALGLTKTDAQRLIEQGGVFKERITPILKDLAVEKSPALVHAARHIPNGWEIVKGEDASPTLTSVGDLELVEFLVGSEEYVVGETMRKRGIKKQAMLGLSDAVWLLEHQSEIPEEMRKYYIVFSGTTLRDPGGYRRVAYLDWSGGQWYLHFHWLDRDFYRDYRLARRKSAGI